MFGELPLSERGLLWVVEVLKSLESIPQSEKEQKPLFPKEQSLACISARGLVDVKASYQTSLLVHLRYQNESEDDDEDEEKGNAKNRKAKKKGHKKKKGKNKTKSSKTQAQGGVAKQPKKKAVQSTAAAYCPGNFSQERLKFISRLKERGFSHKEASSKWGSSQRRAKLLEGMSHAELKRRRFI